MKKTNSQDATDHHLLDRDEEAHHQDRPNDQSNEAQVHAKEALQEIAKEAHHKIEVVEAPHATEIKALDDALDHHLPTVATTEVRTTTEVPTMKESVVETTTGSMVVMVQDRIAAMSKMIATVVDTMDTMVDIPTLVIILGTIVTSTMAIKMMTKVTMMTAMAMMMAMMMA